MYCDDIDLVEHQCTEHEEESDVSLFVARCIIRAIGMVSVHPHPCKRRAYHELIDIINP